MQGMTWQKNVFFFLCFFSIAQYGFAVNWNSVKAGPVQVEKPMPIKGLTGVGINSMALWSGASEVRTAEKLVLHLSPLETYGFSHVVLIVCADWIIEGYCRKGFKGLTKERIVAFTKAVVEKTNLHVVLSLKAYDQKKISGKNTSKLQTSLEEEEATQQAFAEAWTFLAESFKHIERERLSFNLLNEPEFELPAPSSSKRDKWLMIASNAVEAIRAISPDRVIILEGIGKSLFANRKKTRYRHSSVNNLVKPISYEDIIYGFHNYEPDKFLQQAKYRSGVVGNPHTEAVTKAVIKDAARLTKWANENKVSVILSETGCIGYVDGKTEGPRNREDCGLFARDVYDSYVTNGVPVTWWALEKEKTIYERDRPTDKVWMPAKRVPDKYIFRGFRLNF